MEGVRLPEAVVHKCSSKQVFLKISHYSQENTCVWFSFSQTPLDEVSLSVIKMLSKVKWHYVDTFLVIFNFFSSEHFCLWEHNVFVGMWKYRRVEIWGLNSISECCFLALFQKQVFFYFWDDFDALNIWRHQPKILTSLQMIQWFWSNK